MNTKAGRKWKKMDISLENYRIYLTRKPSKYHLDIVDLLYISNFKGGYASIHVKENELNDLLPHYSNILIIIDQQFRSQSLSELSAQQVEVLIQIIYDACALCRNAKIDGFRYSYFSALLHAYFPNLIPILDRRILITLGLVKENNLNSSGQVKEIDKFYPNLIWRIRTISIESGKSLREIDAEYFSKPLPDWMSKRRVLNARSGSA